MRLRAIGISGALLCALTLTGCEGGSNTSSGGTTSGGTSGGATQVGPSTPNGSLIYLDVSNNICIPSQNGKVTIKGRGAELNAGDVFEVRVYFKNESEQLSPAGRPYFNSSVTVSGSETFTWDFYCKKPGTKPYPVGTYKFELVYAGKVIKTDHFDVAEPRG